MTQEKPLLRGHFHQAAFFSALGASAVLIFQSHGWLTLASIIVYSLSLCGLLGISALYHRKQWLPAGRARMRRLDHAGIFILIGGTATPVCLLGMSAPAGPRVLMIFWTAVALGVVQSVFWAKAPKWLAAALYVGVGWLAIPYFSEMLADLGTLNMALLAAGGLVYTAGAVIYALKRPNPWPAVFAYHEIFHVLVIVAAIFHFIVVSRLLR
jgi:hemolysin III